MIVLLTSWGIEPMVTVTPQAAGPGHDVPDTFPRRDLLTLVALTGGAVGVAGFAWPLIDFMNPSRDVLALASVDVALEPISPGMGITVMWRGKPIFVRHRTPAEIAQAQAASTGQLIDPQDDAARVQPGHAEWIVLVGICTHLGCVPLGNRPSDPRGETGGWFCSCHGSQFDTSGRVRVGPAPTNLAIPPYTFLSPTSLRIG
jgi:ubiquinol-cytochrome c reductase iron-sulfur subunit